MKKQDVHNNIRSLKKCLYCLCAFICAVVIIPSKSFAHQAPYSIVYLDVSPTAVNAEIQIPLTELELAFGNELTKNPETLIGRMSAELKKYMLTHAHAYTKKEIEWQASITHLEVDKEQQIASGPPFWELRAKLHFTPAQNEDTRKFILDYDAVVHQVINHIVFVVIRSDWETGRSDSLNADSHPMTIRIASDNKVHPLEITLNKGSWWTGFKNMLSLGMQHIKEGTDHLLFLIVLLLPAMLLYNGKKWGQYGGIHYSIARLLKLVTAFTIGHSLTLLIGALGWLRLSSQPIEILIAFSILVSAVHAIRPIFPRKEMFIALGFGLIHGMAFASVLSNFNLNTCTLALSILGFNIGIELMQLIVIALIVPWLIILSQYSLYKWIRISVAVIAGIASLAWIAERISLTENIIAEEMQKIFDHAPVIITSLALLAAFVLIKNKRHNSNTNMRRKPFTVAYKR